MAVVEFEVVADGVFQFAGAAMDAAAQLFFGKASEPAFDQVEPGGAGRREVQMKARMTQQPALDGRGFVGAVIVDDQMQRESARDLVVNRLQEAGETRPPDGADETRRSRCRP